MTTRARIAVFGPSQLCEAVRTCGFDVADDGVVAVVDATDADAMTRAAQLAASTARVIVAPAELHASLRAFGADPARIVSEIEPAAIGPVIAALLPPTTRPRTRVVMVTGVRGGVGRTLLATNCARRLADVRRVCVVDATGSGAVAWWLKANATSWASIEGLADEMTADHLSVLAHEARRQLYVVGGPSVAPSAAIARATVRAAAAAYDVVIVDGPVAHEPLLAALRPHADRVLVVAYDDPLSIASLDVALESTDWLIASQTAARTLGAHDVFRALARDEGAVASAVSSRESVGGRLGRAYDELSEILAIDAS